MRQLTLREKQSLFAKLVSRLLLRMELEGYEVTLGKALGKTKNPRSLHPSKLAIDLNLFLDGKYQRSTKSHEIFGIWWEQQNSLCRWGGKFKKRDGNHYELTKKPWR